MDKIGVVKELDRLGRIVIQKDLRERYGLEKEVEIIATVDGVLLKSAEYVLTKKDK